MKTSLLSRWAGKTFVAIVFSLFLLPGTAGSQTWANVEVKGKYVFDRLNISHLFLNWKIRARFFNRSEKFSLRQQAKWYVNCKLICS